MGYFNETDLLEQIKHGNIHLMKIIVNGLLIYAEDNQEEGLKSLYENFTSCCKWLRFIFTYQVFTKGLLNMLLKLSESLEEKDPCTK